MMILACVDASAYMASVCDLAAWAATRTGAKVEVLHVIQRKDAIAGRHDLSGAIGLGVKSGLLEELTRIDEAEGRLAIERGRLLLDSAHERLKAAGVEQINLLPRHGGIVETIVEREEQADLVVIGKRGASSEFATEHLGSKLERVVRASTRSVFVASREVRAIESVTLAYDGSPATVKALQLICSSPLFEGLAIDVVTVGDAMPATEEMLAAATAQLVAAGRRAERFLLPGSAEKAIAQHVRDRESGMLVMGAYGHSRLRHLIIGSTTTALVRTVRVPILLVR